MNLKDLRQLLERYGLRPLSGRSQNFLLNDSIVAKMVEASGTDQKSLVLEIGPGPGILTEALLDSGAQVVAVEIDPGMCRLLRDRFGDRPNFRLVEGDVLEMDNRELLDLFGQGGDTSRWRVVANLPYAITSPILEKFLFREPRPSSMTLMLQREVADRILAKPNRMSSLAVACQSLGQPKKVVDVPKGNFFPAPKVDSAVIHIVIKNDTERSEIFRNFPENLFFRIVRQAFSGKRKQLGNSLKGILKTSDELDKSLNLAKIRPTSRPEELTVDEWYGLAEQFNK